jgi:hypothetical protein
MDKRGSSTARVRRWRAKKRAEALSFAASLMKVTIDGRPLQWRRKTAVARITPVQRFRHQYNWPEAPERDVRKLRHLVQRQLANLDERQGNIRRATQDWERTRALERIAAAWPNMILAIARRRPAPPFVDERSTPDPRGGGSMSGEPQRALNTGISAVTMAPSDLPTD